MSIDVYTFFDIYFIFFLFTMSYRNIFGVCCLALWVALFTVQGYASSSRTAIQQYLALYNNATTQSTYTTNGNYEEEIIYIIDDGSYDDTYYYEDDYRTDTTRSSTSELANVWSMGSSTRIDNTSRITVYGTLLELWIKTEMQNGYAASYDRGYRVAAIYDGDTYPANYVKDGGYRSLRMSDRFSDGSDLHVYLLCGDCHGSTRHIRGGTYDGWAIVDSMTYDINAELRSAYYDRYNTTSYNHRYHTNYRYRPNYSYNNDARYYYDTTHHNNDDDCYRYSNGRYYYDTRYCHNNNNHYYNNNNYYTNDRDDDLVLQDVRYRTTTNRYDTEINLTSTVYNASRYELELDGLEYDIEVNGRRLSRSDYDIDHTRTSCDDSSVSSSRDENIDIERYDECDIQVEITIDDDELDRGDYVEINVSLESNDDHDRSNNARVVRFRVD